MKTNLTLLLECSGKKICEWPEFIALINELVQFAVYLCVVTATLTFAYAGFKMMTSGDNAGARSEAKSMMWNVTLGIVVILTAWLVVQFVLTNLGLKGDGYNLLK